MPERGDSSWRAGSGRRWLAARGIWAVAAVGLLVPAASGQQEADPAVAQVIQELRNCEGDPATLARAQARAGDPAGARATLERAVAKASDVQGLLALERVQAEMGERDAALGTLLAARKFALVVRPRGAAPVSVNGHAEPHDPDHDARIAKRQVSEKLADVAIEQSRLGDRAAAGATFDQASRSARALAPDDRNWTVRHVIAAKAKAGDFDSALDDVAAIADRAERFEALTQIDLRGVVDAKVPERILRMIDAEGVPPELPRGSFHAKARAAGIKIDPLIALALAQAAANDRAQAGKTLQGARQIAEALEEDERFAGLRQIAGALVKVGDAAEASRMASAVGGTDPYRKFLILSTIAEAHAEIGDPANCKAWDDLLGAADSDTEKVRVRVKIAYARVKAGDRQGALQALDQALAVERSMNRDELRHGKLMGRDFAESRIVSARAEAGDVAGAIQLARTIEDVQIQGSALAVIAALRADSGDVPGALETVGMIRPPVPPQGFITHLFEEGDALTRIITAQARAGDVAGALAMADRLDPARRSRLYPLSFIAEGLRQRADRARPAPPPRSP